MVKHPHEAASGGKTLLLSLGAAACVLGLLMAFFITRSITGPIGRVVEGLTEGADQVASGFRPGCIRQPGTCRRSIRAGGIYRGNLLLFGRDGLHDKAECRKR